MLLRGSNQLYIKQTIINAIDVFGEDVIIGYFVEMLVFGDYSLKVIGLDGLEEIIEGMYNESTENADIKARIRKSLEGWSKIDNELDGKIKAHLISLLQ